SPGRRAAVSARCGRRRCRSGRSGARSRRGTAAGRDGTRTCHSRPGEGSGGRRNASWRTDNTPAGPRVKIRSPCGKFANFANFAKFAGLSPLTTILVGRSPPEYYSCGVRVIRPAVERPGPGPQGRSMILDRLLDLEKTPLALRYNDREYDLEGYRRWLVDLGSP